MKRFSALEGAMGHLKMSGDLRLRFEPFFGGGSTAAAANQNRFRERYRLRFNINSKIDNDFAVGLSLASGDLGDPVSTNSTETGFFTRKPIAVDKAFGTYTPHNLKPFSVTAGKFGYTWLRTEMVWDNDLNPEGASEQLSWNFKDKFINHFAIIGIESPFFEVSGGPDSYMTGGQVQTGWDLGRKLKLTADVSYYDFANADTIAQNQGQTPAMVSRRRESPVPAAATSDLALPPSAILWCDRHQANLRFQVRNRGCDCPFGYRHRL